MKKTRDDSMTIILMLCILMLATSAGKVFAQDAAEEMARKLQDPLANIKAVMSDNDVLLKTGQDEKAGEGGCLPNISKNNRQKCIVRVGQPGDVCGDVVSKYDQIGQAVLVIKNESPHL